MAGRGRNSDVVTIIYPPGCREVRLTTLHARYWLVDPTCQYHPMFLINQYHKIYILIL